MYIQVVWYGMVYGTSGISYSGCSQDVPNYTIENEQLIFLGFILHVFSLDTASMKWKKAYFQDHYRCLF